MSDANPDREFFRQSVSEWGLERSRQMQAAQKAPDVASDAQYLAVFSGPAGEAVLADLTRLFLDPPYFDPYLEKMAVNYGFVREGQAQVVRHIRGMMKRAMTEKENDHE